VRSHTLTKSAGVSQGVGTLSASARRVSQRGEASVPADAQLRQSLMKEVREAAEGEGLEAKNLEFFPELNSLPLVVDVAELHNISRITSIVAVLQRAADGLPGFEGDRPRVARSDIAGCALAMGSFAGVPGLHARLSALGRQKRLELSTMRGYWRNVAKILVDYLLELGPADIQVAEIPAVAGEWDYVTQRTQVLYMMTGKRPRSVIVTRELRAVSNELSHFAFPIGYPRDIREGVIRVRTLANCVLESSSLGGLGEQYTTLKLPKTPVSETVRFTYEVIINSEVDDLPFLRHRGRVPGGPFLFEVQFDPKELPSTVWHFAERPYDYDPTVAPDPDRIVRLSTFGFGSVEFAREIPDRTCGIAWRWS
jgi:hypothetical protein